MRRRRRGGDKIRLVLYCWIGRRGGRIDKIGKIGEYSTIDMYSIGRRGWGGG